MKKLKNKDIQNIAKTESENGDELMKVFRDLSGVISLEKIKWWLRSIQSTADIDMSNPSGCQPVLRINDA